MTFRQSIGQASQAIDVNQKIGQMAGYGAVEGGVPSIGSRPFAVDFLDATAFMEGEAIQLGATSVDLAEYATESEPRKVVIYIGPSESGDGGEYRVAAGEPARPKPDGKVRFNTFEPSPPDISSIVGTPVAEVWIGGNAQQLIDDDIRDRRLESALSARTIDATQGRFQEMVDGAGVSHTGGLGSAGTNWEDFDIVEVINSDPNHGTDAYHNYFSGGHDFLTGVTSDDHHTRRTDVEDRNAVRGSLDASDLLATSADTPGMHLGVPDGVDSQWVVPPRAEAPVISSGTITHTGGSSTTVLLEGVVPSRLSTVELSLGVTEGSEPTWSADYAYRTSASAVWDSTAQTASIEVTLTWTTDPGAGNDLSLSYAVWDMDRDIVRDLYDDADAVSAIGGATISPQVLAVAQKLRIPVYDTLPAASDSSVGDAVVITGNGTDAWGVYQFDGSSWSGPYTTGLTALSELAINVNKDWNGEPITNVGAPTDPADLLTQETISAHVDDEAAHHAPTASSDIDHAQVSNVQPDQHHAPLTGEDVGDVIAGEMIDVSTTTAQIPTNDASHVHSIVDDGEQVRVLRGEVSDDSGTSPSGLRLEVTNLSTDEAYYSQETRTANGSLTDPLVSIQGIDEIGIQVYNGTGSTVVASGGVSYQIWKTSFGSLITMVDDTDSSQVSARQGVAVEAHTTLAGMRVVLSGMLSGATTAYIQEPGGGRVLGQTDISGMGGGDRVNITSAREITAGETVYVTADAGGDNYTRGRGTDSTQFPYTEEDITVTDGVYTDTGLSDTHRYNFKSVQAIRKED